MRCDEMEWSCGSRLFLASVCLCLCLCQLLFKKSESGNWEIHVFLSTFFSSRLFSSSISSHLFISSHRLALPCLSCFLSLFQYFASCSSNPFPPPHRTSKSRAVQGAVLMAPLSSLRFQHTLPPYPVPSVRPSCRKTRVLAWKVTGGEMRKPRVLVLVKENHIHGKSQRSRCALSVPRWLSLGCGIIKAYKWMCVYVRISQESSSPSNGWRCFRFHKTAPLRVNAMQLMYAQSRLPPKMQIPHSLSMPLLPPGLLSPLSLLSLFTLPSLLFRAIMHPQQSRHPSPSLPSHLLSPHSHSHSWSPYLSSPRSSSTFSFPPCRAVSVWSRSYHSWSK